MTRQRRSRILLWLRVTQLDWFLIVASGCGLCGALIGLTLSPVPGQLFADLAGVPLIYFLPLALGLALAQWIPDGRYWFQSARPGIGTSVVLGSGLAVAFLPAVVTTGGSEVGWVALRDGALACAFAAALRARLSRGATSAAVLLPHLAVWSFGWRQDGDPRAWALIIVPSADPVAAVAALATAATAVALHRRR